MARFYLHLYEATAFIEDRDGIEIFGPESRKLALQAALQAAREIMAADVVEGHLNFTPFIEVRDEAGLVVGSVPFASAVTINAG
jgi:hypothetical protein